MCIRDSPSLEGFKQIAILDPVNNPLPDIDTACRMVFCFFFKNEQNGCILYETLDETQVKLPLKPQVQKNLS